MPAYSARSRMMTAARSRRYSLRRLLLGMVLVGTLFLAVWGRIMPEQVRLGVGERAPRLILSPRTLTYVDSAATERLRLLTASAVPERFRSDPQATQMALQAVDDFFEQTRVVARDPNLPSDAARVEALQARLEFPLSREVLQLALSTPVGTLARVQAGVAELVRLGMSQSIRVNTPDLAAAQQFVAEKAQGLGFTPHYRAFAVAVASAALRPNLVLDSEATAAERKAAAASVPPITHTIRAGDVIIDAGETVTERHLDIFRALGLMNPTVQLSQALAVLALLAILVLSLFDFVRRGFREIYRRLDRMIVICATLAVTAFVFRLAQASPNSEAYSLAIVAAGVMVVSLVTVPRIGMVIAAFSALLLALISLDANVRTVVAVFLAGSIAAFLVNLRGTHTETFVRAAVTTGLLNPVVLLLSTVALGQEPALRLLLVTAGGGAVAALTAIGITLALDRPLDLLTDLRLVELASPHQPLLQRLVREAPGTYQSAVMVANLAEQAATAIGVNGMFVRTAALYHDIGKLKRPYFFVENQFGGDNPHDKLSPFISTLIISSHPRDGVELAREAKLPEPIIDIIAQHQGTDLIRYFYEKAVERAPAGTEVPEEDFRYPGPKPQTKEAAVVMLADTVEAAARTLESPDPVAVEKLVNRLVRAKEDDGQLDESNLTFGELNQVRQTLIASLNSVFHHRIKYPEQIPEEARLLAERLGPEQAEALSLDARERRSER